MVTYISDTTDEKPSNHLSSISDIPLLQKEVFEQKDFIDTIINSLPGIFYLFDSNGKFLRWNKNFEQVSGYSATEIAERHPLDFFDDEDQKLIKERINEVFVKSEAIAEADFLAKDGSKTPYYFTGKLVKYEEKQCLVGMGIDVSLIRQAKQAYLSSEEKLRQSQKIEAIGRLAGGIAHDFNNCLAVIMLHVDMLNLQLPPDSPFRYRVSEIKSVTDSAAKMVRQLLAFGRKQTLQPNPIVLNQVVKEFVKILRPIVGEDIEIKIDLDTDLGVCFVDQNQMIQVLMNLAVNARDAMPNGGVLKIKTANIVFDKSNLPHQSQPLGPYIELAVADNGIGMDTETKSHIFEPFFTTKEPNKGTGLGLATVYGIIKQSNGFIWAESKLNYGTTFRVQFPRIDQLPESLIKDDESPEFPRGDETILLVEDEEKIRRAAVEVLNVLGYRVFEAADGWQALEFAQSFNETIHLLLTDVVMPRMNGRDLAAKVTTLHPETSVLFMSGYNDDIIAQHGVLESGVHLLNKPFPPATLAIKVREVIESGKK